MVWTSLEKVVLVGFSNPFSLMCGGLVAYSGIKYSLTERNMNFNDDRTQFYL